MAKVLDLVPTPPANAFRSASDISTPQACYPLDLYFCEACTHTQLCDVVDPTELFRHYVYVSGTSQAYRKHLEEYADDILARFAPPDRNCRTIEIGSNDGTFLKYLKRDDTEVLGIDPAIEIGASANDAGISTIVDFFSPTLANRLSDEGHQADIIVANHVFAHIDDLPGVLEGVQTLLTSTGVFVFEVNYLLDIYQHNLFDTIYHEHVAYHTVRALQPFLLSHGLQMIEARRTNHQGGSLRVVAQHSNGGREVHSSVRDRLREEKSAGLDRRETFESWGRRLEDLRTTFLAEIKRLLDSGKRIAGFGAPAKCTTLMYYFGIDRSSIEFIVDDNPIKQGLFTPGLNIPVMPPSEIYKQRPDVVVVLAWNFADSIIEKHRQYLDEGGTFVVPLPALDIIKPTTQAKFAS